MLCLLPHVVVSKGNITTKTRSKHLFIYLNKYFTELVYCIVTCLCVTHTSTINLGYKELHDYYVG